MVTQAAALADPTVPAVLIASDLGRPVYERLGFLPVSRWTLWMRAYACEPSGQPRRSPIPDDWLRSPNSQACCATTPPSRRCGAGRARCSPSPSPRAPSRSPAWPPPRPATRSWPRCRPPATPSAWPTTSSTLPRPRPGRDVPGLGDAPVRAGQPRRGDHGPAPPHDVAAPRPRAGAPRRGRLGPGPPAAARPPRRGHRAARHRQGRAARPRRHRRLADRRRLPAGGAGRAPGRDRGAGVDRRRVPVDRRRARAHRPVGRRGRPPHRVLRRRPALHHRPPRDRAVRLPGAAPHRRRPGPGRPRSWARSRGAASSGSGWPRASCSTAWSRGCRGWSRARSSSPT